MAIQIQIYSDNHVFDEIITDEYIVKSLTREDQLASGLDSSSSTRKFSLTKDCPYLLPILSWNGKDSSTPPNTDSLDLHVIISDGTTLIFTGYLSDRISWGIDTHGADILTLTAEDMGTHLLKNPYTKNESTLITGTFSQCLTSICTSAGISLATNIPTLSTNVSCIADSGESCESLLKDLCREFGYAYYFQADGRLNIKALSSDNLSSIPTVMDNELYDSITINKKAKQYRGSRIEWKKLADRSGALIYRDITNQSTSHPDCWIELSLNQSYPANTPTAIKAVDLKQGAEVYAISNISPTVEWARSTNGTHTIQQYGADSLKVIVTCTSTAGLTKGYVSKLQATADLKYVESTEIVYGNTDHTSENLYESECRWIHDATSAEKYANFCAQYWEYSSRSFTFKSKQNYALGQIIQLNENVFTGLTSYLMIQKISDNGVSDVKTYEAVSTSEFSYYKHTDKESMYIPPSDSYIEVPDAASLTISPSKSTVEKDLRSSATQTLGVKVFTTGTITSSISLSASLSDGTVLTVTPVTGQTNEWAVTVPKSTQATEVNLVAIAGIIEERVSVSFVDRTYYNLFHGALSSAPTSPTVVLNGDYYLNTTDGITYEWNGTQWIACEDAEKLLESLHAARHQNPPIDFNDPAFRDANTVAWFNTILAAKGIIDSLFSHEITLLDPGYIKSSNYGEPGEEIVCEYDLSNVNPGSFSLDEDTFINSTWGYGTYKIECTRAYKSNPQSSEGTDDGEWSIMKDGVQMATTSDCDGLEYYGISIDFDGEGYTTNTGNYFTIVSSEQTTGGQGFYLGSDGTLRCYSAEVINANATNLVIGGNSSFNGSFNCGVISTNLAGLTPYPYDSSLNERYCKEIIDAMEASGMFIANQIYPCSVSPNPTRNGAMVAVAFMRYEHPTTNTYYLYFYDENKSVIDLKTCDNYQVSYEGGATPPNRTEHLYTIYNSGSQFGWGGGYFTYHPTITILTGGNYLSVNVPSYTDRASVPPGCVFLGAASTPDASGNYYFPLLVKGGSRTIGVPTTANDASQAYFLATDLINEGIRLNTSYNCQVMNHLSQIVPTIAKVAVTEAPSTSGGRYNATVQFYDAGGNAVDLVTQAGLHIQRQLGNGTPSDRTSHTGGLVSDTGVALTDTSYFCPEGLTVIVEIVV